MRTGGGLPEFLARVRRRYLRNLVLDQFVHASILAMGGAILLLILGTQILDWYWLVILFAGSLVIGTVRLWRRAPSQYELAQIVDRRLDLKDALSTAHFFASSGRRASATIIEAQRRQAEQLARDTDVRVAAPVVVPRRAWAAGLMAMLAFAMLGVRYGVRRSLDLRPPISGVVFEIFRGANPLLAQNKKDDPRKKPDNPADQMGMALDPPPDAASADAKAPDTAQANDNPANDSSDAKRQQALTEDSASENGDADEGEGNEASDSAPTADGTSAPQEEQAQGQPNSAKGNQPKQGKQPNQPGEHSSMLDKMRDAMANLLNKLGIQPKTEGTQTASKSKDGSPSGKQQQQAGQRAQKGGQNQQQGSPNGEQSGEQEGEGAERSQMAQGRGGEHGADPQAPQDAKSGIGKNDGSKELRDAEQLAAMGKISEILGKRAQNITGEVMIEVAGGKQQLKTPYAQRTAAHAEAGGESNRDEVPLEFQSFVQQYFQEIHKQPQQKPAARK